MLLGWVLKVEECNNLLNVPFWGSSTAVLWVLFKVSNIVLVIQVIVSTSLGLSGILSLATSG